MISTYSFLCSSVFGFYYVSFLLGFVWVLVRFFFVIWFCFCLFFG